MNFFGNVCFQNSMFTSHTGLHDVTASKNISPVIFGVANLVEFVKLCSEYFG